MRTFFLLPRRVYSRVTSLLCALLLACPVAFAQSWPVKPLTLIVPFAPGGGTDSIARDLAQLLGAKLGQSVVVDNRGGAGGAIAAEVAAKARPDGHTLLFVTSTFITHAAAAKALAYDVLRDFSPIAMLGRGPLLLVANRELPVRSVADLVALARQKAGALNFCSAGNGSINHLAGEMFVQRTGANMTHVPYKGSAPATVDLLSGQVQVFFATAPTILGHVRAGRVNLLAVTGARRSRLFADVPTMAESGIANYEVSTWWGVVAPAGTPAAVVNTLNTAIHEAAESDRLRRRFADEGAEGVRGDPVNFAIHLAAELKSWRAVVAIGNIKLD